MIAVKIAGNNLVMGEKSSITMEHNNPLFDEELIKGEYAFPFDIPYHGNGRALDFIYELPLVNRKRSFPKAELRYKGVKLNDAILDINSVKEHTVNGSLRVNFSALQCISKKLRDFDYGNDIVLGETMSEVIDYCNAQCSQAWPAVAFNFPMIYNPRFYDGKNPHHSGYLNFYDSDSGVYFDNSTVNQQALVPMVYLFEILKRGFAYDGYTINNTGFYADALQKKIIVYNNKALDGLEVSSATVGMHATLSSYTYLHQTGEEDIVCDDETTNGNYDALGAYDHGDGKYEIQAAGMHNVRFRPYWTLINQPNPSYKDTVVLKLYLDTTLLKTVTQEYYGVINANLLLAHNYNASAGDIGKEFHVTMEYYNSITPASYLRLNGSTYFSVNDYSTTTSLNTFQKVFNLRDHVPDVTFGQLLNALRKTKLLTFDYDHTLKTVSILYFQNVRSQVPVDISAGSQHGHEIKNIEASLYKLFKWKGAEHDENYNENFKEYNLDDFLGEFNTPDLLNTGLPPGATLLDKTAYIRCLHQVWKCAQVSVGVYKWVYYTDAYYDVVVNDTGSIEVQPDISPPMMTLRDDVPHNLVVMLPHIANVGTSAEFELGTNPYDLQMFYYHGLSQVSSSQDLPTSTTTNISYTNTSQGTLNFQWRTDGLLSLYTDFLEIVQRGEIILKRIKLTLPQLLQFRITSMFHTDNTRFLAKNMNVSIGDEIEIATFELYRL